MIEHITWAGALVRAEQTLKEAGEAFSLRDYERGMTLLAEQQACVSKAVEFIMQESGL